MKGSCDQCEDVANLNCPFKKTHNYEGLTFSCDELCWQSKYLLKTAHKMPGIRA